MQKPFSLDSDLAFFEIENIAGNIEYNSAEVKYYNLFDFLDLVEDLKEGIIKN